MQPTVLAVLGSTGELVRLCRGLTLPAAGRQSALESVEDPWDMVNELRAGQGRGRAYSGVVGYGTAPAVEDLIAPLPEMGGNTGEFAESGRMP